MTTFRYIYLISEYDGVRRAHLGTYLSIITRVFMLTKVKYLITELCEYSVKDPVMRSSKTNNTMHHTIFFCPDFCNFTKF